MKLPPGIAHKLLQMTQGETLPASMLKHQVVHAMIEDGVLQKIVKGKSKSQLLLPDVKAMHAYLFNRYGITNLEEYVMALEKDELTRAEAISVSGNSKLRNTRTFKGFIVNSYQPIEATLHNNPFIIHPADGSFVYVYDHQHFTIPAGVTIVGIENSETFRQVRDLQYLFAGIKPLFTCRYPHSGDLVQWLKVTDCTYLHFGDLDFAGIQIFQHEYKAALGDKATFFIPPYTEELISRFGNRQLYDKQLHLLPSIDAAGPINELITCFHKHKKVLEQEIFLNANVAGR